MPTCARTICRACEAGMMYSGPARGSGRISADDKWSMSLSSFAHRYCSKESLFLQRPIDKH